MATGVIEVGSFPTRWNLEVEQANLTEKQTRLEAPALRIPTRNYQSHVVLLLLWVSSILLGGYSKDLLKAFGQTMS